MKFAYLIAAHNQFDVLKKLLAALDDERNDIYIHIDSKAEGVVEEEFKEYIRFANIYFIKRRSVTWGGYSQIRLEIDLLREATSTYHDYYHFISGVDMPIKSNDSICAFFEMNKGKEFIHFDYETKESDVNYRIGQYYFFQELVGRKKGILKSCDMLLAAIQKILGLSRTKETNLLYKKGANWFSITHELARYVIEREPMIKKNFGKSVCADELFLQTLVFNSPFKNNLFYSENQKRYFNLRLVDWERGNPYIFRKEDLNFMLESDCIFARKFDSNIDKEIVDMLVDNLKRR